MDIVHRIVWPENTKRVLDYSRSSVRGSRVIPLHSSRGVLACGLCVSARQRELPIDAGNRACAFLDEPTAAQTASTALDADRSTIYVDLIMSSLGEAARQALENMDARKYEYQSDFARRYVAQGRAEGRAALIIRLLTLRFGAIDSMLESHVRRASEAELDAIAERLLSASTLQEALGPG